MGCQLLQKSYIAQVDSNTRPENDGVLPKYWMEDANFAIISKELFAAVQEELARKRALGPMATSSRTTSILTGRVQCVCCDKNYQHKTKAKKDGLKRRFWNTNLEKDSCGRRFEEPGLKRLLCEHFGLKSFDEAAYFLRHLNMEASMNHIVIVDIDDKRTRVEK